MLLAANVSNTLKAVPGLSSTPITEILAVFLSAATPVTNSFSHSCSLPYYGVVSKTYPFYCSKILLKP